MRLKECKDDSDCPQATPICQVGTCHGMFCYNATNEVINHTHINLFEPHYHKILKMCSNLRNYPII